MTGDAAKDYGWSSAQGPQSCGYITPRIREILKKLQLRRVLDLGAGNGALCAQLASDGYEVVGVEYDQQGVDLAKKAYPEISFYRFGVQDDPAELLVHEEPFDAAVSTEVIEHPFSLHLLPMYARDCLREGGYLILSTPYHGYLKNLV
jgi:2-polyprenyl-3-methyl-5-hydroxy-6-metoxy-1,4-benzoquinol methylase